MLLHDPSTGTLSNVEKQFSKLVVEIAKIPLSKLKQALDNLSTHTLSAIDSETFFTNDISEIKNASSSFNLTLALSSYWSLVNFSLLEYLLQSKDSTSSDKSSTQKMIYEYVSTLSSLKISHLPALLHPVGVKSPFSDVPIVVKMKPQYIQNETVGNLLCAMNAIAKTLDLEPQSVLLKALDRRKQELLIHLPSIAMEGLSSFESTRFLQLPEQHSIQIGSIFPNEVTAEEPGL